jgi:mannosyl-oligosaccharide glucosidase
MEGYGWTKYDPRNGGTQIVHDVGNKLNLSMDYFKVSGGKHGGSWGARIKGTPRVDAPKDLESTVIFYVGMEDLKANVDSRLESSIRKEQNSPKA